MPSTNPDFSLLELSAEELLQRYTDRTLSPVDVADAVFAAIDEHDPTLHAFLAVNGDEGRRAAKAAERQWKDGDAPPLCGVPVSVKDSMEMAGLPTTYGSLAFKDNVQPDCVLVKRLREAGAVVVGKTNLPEFALSPETSNRLGPPTLNPWNTKRSAGGSSGGAGAAVAAGFGPIAMGTDSGGSIRCPAAYNGVFGIKPTYQRIPAVQKWRAAPGRSHNGPLSRTVNDTALLMSVLTGSHPGDPESNLPVPSREAWFESVDSMHATRVAVAASHSDGALGGAFGNLAPEAAELLAGVGADVVEASPPAWEPFPIDGDALPHSADHYAAAVSLRPTFWEDHCDDLTPYVRGVYDAGRRVLAWQYRQALGHAQAYRETVQRWFVDNEVDFVVMQATGVAPEVNRTEEDLRPPSLKDLVPFNMSRNPAASVPFGFDEGTGLPVAVQVIGRVGEDPGVLRVCRLLEAMRPWAHYWPPDGAVAR